ncbi:hypothetical protein [Luteibacter yeojuensis]|uniref:Uncharacterized protein n=1 Tax=Luteibacter yeojuensis TaxID=345309 RepID=A0A0F3KX08_9GAMM|nr:hypothetical protein [Luteibacter yeojuensis]KJV35686.1 hypothetical protein VI08_06680 [Luteibacter yeojuensis]
MGYFWFAVTGAVAGAMLTWAIALLLRNFGRWRAWAAWLISAGLIAACVFMPDYSGRDGWLALLGDAGNQIALVSAAIGAAVPTGFWSRTPSKA